MTPLDVFITISQALYVPAFSLDIPVYWAFAHIVQMGRVLLKKQHKQRKEALGEPFPRKFMKSDANVYTHIFLPPQKRHK